MDCGLSAAAKLTPQVANDTQKKRAQTACEPLSMQKGLVLLERLLPGQCCSGSDVLHVL